MTTINRTEETYSKDWKSSNAKDVLRRMIERGVVTKNHDPSDVYKMCEDFKRYKFQNFKTNLRNLLNSIEKERLRVTRDERAYNNDLEKIGRATVTKQGKPIWAGSEAEKALKHDITNGVHLSKTPIELWESKEAYKVFDLKTFRDKIYQIKQQRLGRAYWMNEARKKQKRSKK